MANAAIDEKVTPETRWRFARRLAPLAVVVLGLSLGYAFGLHQYLSLDFLAESRGSLIVMVERHPLLAPLVFALLYTIAVAFAFPAASVLTIFGGFLFGWLPASLLVAMSATLGATLLFLAARSAFGDVLRRRLSVRVDGLARGFEENAFGYLLALRLAPILPFFAVNIAPAFFDVKLRTYVLATFLGILPGVLAYTFLGTGVDSVLLAAAQSGESVSPGDLVTPQITLAFVGLGLVALLPAVVRTLQNRRGRGAQAGSDPVD
jgi:uncharacterized membrane protein YdjX (TVP38/TMEM64 family)